MTHFAIPGDEFSSLEDEPFPVFDDGDGNGDMMFADGIEPLGLSLVPKEVTFTIVIYALAAGLDVARWWGR